jgi:hypothetical protein
MIFVLILALAAVHVHAQWGGAFMGEQDFQKSRTSGEFSTRSSPFDGQPGGAGKEMPRATAADEFKDKWMPTGRSDFQVPDDIKKMMEAAQTSKPTSRAEFRSSTGFGSKMNPKTGTPVAESAETDDDDEEEEEDDDKIPKSAPGRSGEGRRMDKCLRKVAPFCSLRVMNENFAAFVHCVVDVRYRIGEECREWAEGHMPCAADLAKHCDFKTPSDATECLRARKSQLSRMCVDSKFYVSMEEGFGEFREGMKKGMEGTPPGSKPHYAGPQDNAETPASRDSSKQQQQQRSQRERPSVVRVVPKAVVSDPDDEF